MEIIINMPRYQIRKNLILTLTMTLLGVFAVSSSTQAEERAISVKTKFYGHKGVYINTFSDANSLKPIDKINTPIYYFSEQHEQCEEVIAKNRWAMTTQDCVDLINIEANTNEQKDWPDPVFGIKDPCKISNKIDCIKNQGGDGILHKATLSNTGEDKLPKNFDIYSYEYLKNINYINPDDFN